MPLYDYQCKKCNHEFERVFKLSKNSDLSPCPNIECGGTARKILKPGYGGVHGSEPTWINQDLRNQLQPDDITEKPVENRQELNKYMKKHGIVHKDRGVDNLMMV